MSSLTDDQLRVDSEVTIKCGNADHRMQRGTSVHGFLRVAESMASDHCRIAIATPADDWGRLQMVPQLVCGPANVSTSARG